MRVPDEWVNPPVLPLHLAWVRDAFYKLSTCRQAGFGMAPIPWTAVIKYAEFMGLSDDDTDRFDFLIGRLDDVVLRYYEEKSPKPKDKK